MAKAYFTCCSVFRLHPCCSMCQNLLPSKDWTTFHCMYSHNIPLYVQTPFPLSIYLLMGSWMTPNSAIINNVAMNMNVQLSSCDPTFNPFGYITPKWNCWISIYIYTHLCKTLKFQLSLVLANLSHASYRWGTRSWGGHMRVSECWGVGLVSMLRGPPSAWDQCVHRSPPAAARPRGPDEPGLTSLSRSFSRKWRATWLGRMFRSMFSLCSLSSFISLISSLAWTRHRKSRRAVYSSCGSGDRREGTGSDTRLWEVDRVSPEPSADETEPKLNALGGLSPDTRRSEDEQILQGCVPPLPGTGAPGLCHCFFPPLCTTGALRSGFLLGSVSHPYHRATLLAQGWCSINISWPNK